MADKEKIEKLAEYFMKHKRIERAADALFEIEEYEEAAFLYNDWAVLARRDQNYRGAHRGYLKAAQAYLKMKKPDLCNEMQKHASSCEQYFIGEMHVTGIRDAGSDVREGISRAGSIVAGATREAAEINAGARIQGARTLAGAVKGALGEIANRVFVGLKSLSEAQREVGMRMAASVSEGFERLSAVQKDAALQQARAILQGFEQLSNATKAGALLKAYAALKGSENISESEREVAKSIASLSTTMKEGLPAIAQATFQGFSNLAEAEKFGSVLNAKVTDEASRRKQEALMALGEEIAKGTKLLSWSQLKASRTQRAAIEGHIFSRGVWQGLKDILSFRLWRKGVVNALEQQRKFLPVIGS